MGKTVGQLEEYTPAAASIPNGDMVKVVPTVVLNFLHVELHPVVLCHEPVVVLVFQGGVRVFGPVEFKF